MMRPHTPTRPASTMLPRLFFGALLLLTVLPVMTIAQSATSGSTASGIAPGSPVGSYALSEFESVNSYNGGLNFRLPLVSVGGRGGTSHTVTLPIEQKWRVVHTVDGYSQDHYVPDANWWAGLEPGYGPGVLQGRQAGDSAQQCAFAPYDSYYYRTLTRLTFTTPDGTEYDLRDSQTGGQPANTPSPGYGCQPTNFNRGRNFVTADGTSATFVSDADIFDEALIVSGGGDGLIYPSGYLMLRDGTRLRIDGGQVQWIRDRNGNKTTFGYGAYARVVSITDSLGRTVTVSYADQLGTSYDQLTFSGFGGAARNVRVWNAALGSVLRTTQTGDSTTTKTFRELFPELFDASQYTSYNPQKVSAVELPDGRRYEFRYNVYGELARVTLPTGGAFEYDYAAGVVGEFKYNFIVGGMAEATSGVTGEASVYRRVVARRVYADGATLESKTTFSRPESYNSGSLLYENLGYVEVDQLNAQSVLLSRTRHYYHGGARNSLFKTPLEYAGCTEGKEYKTEAYDTNGTTVLRRSETNWQPGVPLPAAPLRCANMRVADVRTTLADAGLVTRQVFGYDQYNNQTDAWEYHYGVGAPSAHPARHTHTDYLTVNPVNGVNYATDTSVHLRGLVSDQYIYSVNPSTGGETLAAHSHYDYDQSALTDRPGITGLDAAFTTGYTKRGNLTSATHYADAAAGTGAVTSTTSYDIAGSVVSLTDPRGKTSYVGYADSFCNGSTCGGTFTPNTFAFPTQTTSPVPDPTNQYGTNTALVSTTVYDFWTGRVASTTDANNQTTTLEYDANDELDRLKAVNRPAGGGRTDYEYGDTAENLYLRTLVDLDATRRLETYQRFDGLGRAVRSASYDGSSPNPWSVADTKYDAMGRVEMVSSPYRAENSNPSNPTSVKWTTSIYDALGRVRAVTTPDGAAVTTSYSGNMVEVTDQTGKKRRSYTDALGRLDGVVEDPAGLNYATNYKYDALGNLREVIQGAQHRYFVYDSLGRLLRAKNPEQDNLTTDADFPALTDAVTANSQWSLGYKYDEGGNLVKRKDARNVVTTYAYDALSRNTAVSYSDATPHVKRIYDGAANGRGRFHADWKWDGAGTHYTHLAVDGYDAVGRPLNHRRHFYTNNVASAAFNTQRTYDLASNVTGQTYPSGRTVSYTYDAAGRLNSFTGNLGDGTPRTYANEVRYDEASRVQQERYGTTTPVYNKSLYNIRGQLAEIRVSTQSLYDAPGGLPTNTNWNRGAIINHYSEAQGAWGATDGNLSTPSLNNGNLKKQDVFIPNAENYESAGLSVTTQFYTYDALNRLDMVFEDGAQDWQQDYEYDRWGNRKIVVTTTTNGIPKLQFDVDTGMNQLRVPTGVLGTMTYDAAGHLTTDTYSANAQSRLYDAEGRMTKETSPASVVTGQYTYDADGRRVKRVANGVETWQVYGMDGELLGEYAPNAATSAPQKEYGYRAGQLLVTAAATGGGGGGGGAATNLALGKPATQSSTYTGVPGITPSADKAVDGNTDGAFLNGSVTSTNSDAQAWWQVDMGSVQSVGEVRAWNRADCCGDRLGNFYVFVSDSPFSSTDLNATLNQPGVSNYYTAGQGGRPTAVSVNRTGRYVRVQLAGTNYLSLAEVEVLSGGGGGSSTLPVTNSSFETPGLGGGYQYAPSGAAWSFVNGAGITGNNNAFTSGNPAAPDGAQVAFVQATGEMSQSVSGFQAATTYTVSFRAAQRGNISQAGQDIEVFLDTTSLGGFTPAGTSYHQMTTASFTTTAGSHVLKFVGKNTAGGDNTAFVDQVQITGAAGGGAETNLALGQPATQSSTYDPGSPASRATDGTTSGSHAAGTISHTNLDAQAWWQVDLGAVKTLNTVKVWNRAECCTGTTSNFYVLVSDAPFTSTNLTTTINQAGVSNYYVAGSAGAPTEVSVNRSGRYVRVQLAGTNYLTLSEVEVLGSSGGGGGSGGGSSIQWLVADQLGTPRMVIDQSGSLSGVKRHDYLPFGEELQAGTGGRTTQQGYSQPDGVRQHFVGSERDAETGLDFMQARYFSSTQGRFTSTDPLYFQVEMAIDPQRFNLYAYARNNPLKWVDPNGERLYLRGDNDWLRTNVLYGMVGGQEQFDRYFQISDGQVVLREGVDTSNANAGVQLLLELVNSTDNYLYHAGTDGEAAADLFQGSRDGNGNVTRDGQRRAAKFDGTIANQANAEGTLVGTRGRGQGALQPANLANGDPVFAVIAYNTEAVQIQGDIARGPDSMEGSVYVAFPAQYEGRGQRVLPVSLFIHESAENLVFAQQGSNMNYGNAHRAAMRREATIRRDLRITGGFAGGGQIQTNVPPRR